MDVSIRQTISQTGAANLLRLKPSTVRNLIAQGRLKTVETSDGHRLLTLAEVERYKRERRPVGRPKDSSSSPGF